MTDRELMQQALKLALEALTATMSTHGFKDAIDEAHDKAITAIREALMSVPDGAEQPAQQQEPVAWANERAIQWLHDRGPTASITTIISKVKSFERPLPLYTSPPYEATPLANANTGKPWVWLTHDEVNSWELPDCPTVFEFAQFIEAKLKENNTR